MILILRFCKEKFYIIFLFLSFLHPHIQSTIEISLRFQCWVIVKRVPPSDGKTENKRRYCSEGYTLLSILQMQEEEDEFTENCNEVG